jgi:xanthine dehydrogenase accessory factor
MPRADVYDDIARLRAEGRPFAVATVVRTADATSAKAGSKAAVTEDGEILGHLGGGCVMSAVRKAAAAALAEGSVRMIRVTPADKIVALYDAEGIEMHKSGCPSGGSADILIEPHAPPPLAAILGTGPVAAALAAQAKLMGWRVAADAAVAPRDAALDIADLGALRLGPRDAALVATQGRRDLDALRAALSSEAGDVAMVASRRKAEVLLGRLRDAGFDPATLARLRAPAGLDLGGVDPEEIALSIFAEIVQRRNRARRDASADGAARRAGA